MLGFLFSFRFLDRGMIRKTKVAADWIDPSTTRSHQRGIQNTEQFRWSSGYDFRLTLSLSRKVLGSTPGRNIFLTFTQEPTNGFHSIVFLWARAWRHVFYQGIHPHPDAPSRAQNGIITSTVGISRRVTFRIVSATRLWPELDVYDDSCPSIRVKQTLLSPGPGAHQRAAIDHVRGMSTPGVPRR